MLVDMNNMLSFVENIETLQSMRFGSNRLRGDKVENQLSRQEGLKNADCFRVPKVIEQNI